ncbi:Aste57867_24920 [Aphanomyces stellatus]|uniref:Aste57867_24920 protein n=1 Tax=Aphanomyces stellatus TaxID=120398 RepID=A0A485LSM8_9STRA|nr:hypothetical protein As57867_024842 [Aphanomyces stellatus]VFU01552.1 Aste57867_24920 [Aphanomyces stellatus]
MVKVLTASLFAATALAGSISDLPADMLKVMDTAADPCQDFWQYSCGGWLKTAVLPPTKSHISYPDDKVAMLTDAVIKKVLASNKPKLSEFYASCMDTKTLASLGLTPIQKDLAVVRGANSPESILRVASNLSSKGLNIFGQPDVMADSTDATRNAVWVSQPELPIDQDYYSSPEKWAKINAAYHEYIATLFTLSGKSPADAKAAADDVVKFEFYVGAQLNKIELLEAQATPDNPMTFAQANAKYPLAIGTQLNEHGFNVCENLTSSSKVIVYDLTFFDRVEVLLKATSVKTLKTVVEYRLLSYYAPHMSANFVTANWKLFKNVIGGQQVQATRDVICQDALDTTIGEMLGKYYLEQVWPQTTANRADEMVVLLEAAFKAGLDTSDWLDKTTRDNAKTKLSKFLHLLGGPKTPKTYDSLTFSPKTYITNRHPIGFQGQVRSIRQACQQTALGGRNYNGNGNKNPWWSDAVTTAFDTKSQCIIDQYSGMEVYSETSLGKLIGKADGKLLGETIADNGGLKSAYRAYKELLKFKPSNNMASPTRGASVNEAPRVGEAILLFSFKTRTTCPMNRQQKNRQKESANQRAFVDFEFQTKTNTIEWVERFGQ